MSTLPPTSPSVPYSKQRSQLGTGDLVFLHGTSPAGVMIEQLEELAGWPPYSHVGMVVKDGTDLYLWDAPGGGDCFEDPYAETDPDNRMYPTAVHNGCRVSVLDDVLAYYATKVDVGGFWLRQLTSGVSADQFAALRTFINLVDGQLFPTGPGSEPDVTGLGANFLAGQDRGSLFFGTYFCAQLVADSYMRMGLLGMDDFPPNGYSPAAFSMSNSSRLPLAKGVTLADVIFLQWDLPTKSGSGTPCPPT
jgi:hypothetical protein